MPRPRRVVRKRRGARKGRARRSGPARTLRPNWQVASVVETIDPGYLLIENVPYFQQTYLQAFKRCIGMANLYEQFRIEEVAYTYSPFFNTFQEGLAGATSVPFAYVVKDRLQSLNPATTTLTDIIQMGAQRIRFDKPFTIRYKPNTMVTTGASNPAVASAQILQINGTDYGRWFPCVTQNIGSGQDNTPQTLSAHTQLYNGHWVFFDQTLADPNTQVASVSITIRVSYKNPMVNETPLPPTTSPIPIHAGLVENRVYTIIHGLTGPTGSNA